MKLKHFNNYNETFPRNEANLKDIVILRGRNTGRLKSSNFGFCKAIFDTMKLFYDAKSSKSLVSQGLLGIEKA